MTGPEMCFSSVKGVRGLHYPIFPSSAANAFTLTGVSAFEVGSEGNHCHQINYEHMQPAKPHTSASLNGVSPFWLLTPHPYGARADRQLYDKPPRREIQTIQPVKANQTEKTHFLGTYVTPHVPSKAANQKSPLPRRTVLEKPCVLQLSGWHLHAFPMLR